MAYEEHNIEEIEARIEELVEAIDTIGDQMKEFGKILESHSFELNRLRHMRNQIKKYGVDNK